MREIKFRGKTISGEWVYGFVSNPKLSNHVGTEKAGNWYISNKAGSPYAYEVSPETVGQYIGLKDKNGKEIYEGDIMEIGFHNNLFRTFVKSMPHNGEFVLVKTKSAKTWYSICPTLNDDKEWQTVKEVIGNEHDNPDLLK